MEDVNDNSPVFDRLYSLSVLLSSVEDVNDNSPVFDRAGYHCQLTELPGRGQFVTMVSAHDPDDGDRLVYRIAEGNDRQFFYINNRTGRQLSCIDKRKGRRAVLQRFIYQRMGDGWLRVVWEDWKYFHCAP